MASLSFVWPQIIKRALFIVSMGCVQDGRRSRTPDLQVEQMSILLPFSLMKLLVSGLTRSGLATLAADG